MVRYICLVVVSLFGSTVASGTLYGDVAKTLRTSVGDVQVGYDEFGDPRSSGCLILLYGSNGTALPLYREQAALFGTRGFHVRMPHYFDAMRSAAPSTDNYQKWATVTKDFVAECRSGAATRKVFLIGYSLGASVALTAGSEGAGRCDHGVVWKSAG